ncbi:MAG: hypothetical protein KDC57_08660 [Saprospiraceae bacterium]|nr:hypothetical protein [Saprospiraceae bacterium]
MKKLFLLSILICFFLPGMAQSNRYLKASACGLIEAHEINIPNHLEQSITFYLMPLNLGSLTVVRNTVHELEIVSMQIQKDKQYKLIAPNTDQAESIDSYKKFSMGMRLQYALSHLFLPGSKIRPAVGVGVQPYARYTSTQPLSSLGFPVRNVLLGTSVVFIPRMIIIRGERWLIDVNVPMGILDLFWQRKVIQNPILSAQNQSNIAVKSTWLPDLLQVSAGVAYRL